MRKVILIVFMFLCFFTVTYLFFAHLGILTEEATMDWLLSLGYKGGIVSSLLLMSDLVLPVPSSILMTANGVMVGFIGGGMLSFFSSLFASCLGFVLCRRFGRRIYRFFVNEEEDKRVNRFFKRYGDYAIIFSKIVPLMSETLSCLAGLTTMKLSRFILVSSLGLLPISFIYSYAGKAALDYNTLWPAIIVSLIIPAIGLGIYRILKKE